MGTALCLLMKRNSSQRVKCLLRRCNPLSQLTLSWLNASIIQWVIQEPTPSLGQDWSFAFNNTKRRTLTTQFMEFTSALHYSPSRYREFEWRGAQPWPHAPIPIKNSILIHNTGEHKCTSIKLEMASGKKQNHTLPQAKREIKGSKWRTQ